MIRFGSSAKLQMVLAGATTTTALQAIVGYSDDDGVSTYTGNWAQASSNGTTDVDLLAAPSSGVIRDVDWLSIHNRDTAAATVTVKLDVSATDYVINTVTLASGDNLHFTHAAGWRVTDSTGSFKSSGGGSSYSVFDATTDGLVPKPTTSTNRFLRDDATWVVPANGLIYLTSGVAASVSSIDLTSLITSSYYGYALWIGNLVPATTGVCYVRTSTNNSTFDSGASDYSYTGMETTASGSSAVTNSTGAAQIALGGNSILQTTANGGLSGWLYIFNPSGTAHYKQIRFDGTYAQSGGLFGINLSGNRIATADVDAMRLIMASGNIASCTYVLYALAKS
jgi:hypothetical protein